MTTTKITQTAMDTIPDAVHISAQSASTKGTRREKWLRVRANHTRLIEKHSHLLVDMSALEAAIGNKPLFTRGLLEQAAADLKEARVLGHDAGPIHVPHVIGDGKWTSNWYGPDINLSFTRSYKLLTTMGKAPLYGWMPNHIGKDFIVDNVLKPDDIDTHPMRKAIAGWPPSTPQLSKMVAMQQRIEVSQAMEGIKKLLVASLVRIDNIVCLALRDPVPLKDSNCGQHLLACAIADAVAGHKESAAAIPIVAFDPEYDIAACHLLAHLPHPIHVVSSPYEYLSMTPNSLIICIGIPVFMPAYEIMADSLFPLGPAALMCFEFREEPWHAKGLISLYDPLVPRVAKMFQQYEMNWLGDFVPAVQDGGLEGLQWLQSVVWYSRKE